MKNIKSILIIFFLTLIFQCSAQTDTFSKPDYDEIKRHIEDSTSAFYYPQLMRRLVAFDTLLTREEYTHLYYGYIFQEAYQPYDMNEFDKIQKFYEWPSAEEFSPDDLKELVEVASEKISKNPFDLRPMNMLSYAYHLQGNDTMAMKVSYRLNGTVGAILWTGDGRSCETAFHVINVPHEYVILNMFHFEVTQQALIDNRCDVITLSPDRRGVLELYFDISKLFANDFEPIKE